MMNFLTYIQMKPDFMALGLVDAGKIAEAEQKLGVKFAKEYVDYVKDCGAATFSCHEMTGICSSKRLSVVDVTQKQRQANPDIPSDWYVVEECGIDGACMWQDAVGKIYCTLPGDTPKEVASSLLEYVEE